MLVFHLDELITCHADATGTYKHVPLYEIYVCANTLYKYVMNTHIHKAANQAVQKPIQAQSGLIFPHLRLSLGSSIVSNSEKLLEWLKPIYREL